MKTAQTSDAPTSFDPLDYLDIARQILEARKRGEELEYERYSPEEQAWGAQGTVSNPLSWLAPDCWPIRIKPAAPWVLGREVNGFVLGEGQEWYKGEQFVKSDLNAGERPAISGEKFESGEAMVWKHNEGPWSAVANHATAEGFTVKLKTTRPLPPVKWAAEREAYQEGKSIQYRPKGYTEWRDCDAGPMFIDAHEYRVAPEPREVPLEAADVPPGSVFSLAGMGNECWRAAVLVSPEGVGFAYHEDLKDNGISMVSFQLLLASSLIHRPGDNDSNGKPIFRKCSKLITP